MSQYYHPIDSTSSNGSSEEFVTTDLDSFLSGVYRYYCEKGLNFVIFRCVSSLIASLLTFILSVLLLLLIDWDTVVACTSEETCIGLSLLYSNPIWPLTLYRFVIICQLVPLGLYTVVLASASAIAKVREAIRIGEFYRTRLGVVDDSLLTFISWPEIVERLIAFQAANRLCILQPSLSALEITNVIMRTDNMVLYMMKNIAVNNAIAQSRVMKWCLQFGLVAWLFDERYRIRRSLNIHTIRARLKLLGYLSLVLIGPMVIFAFILLVIREMDDVRANRSSLTDRQWTPLARNKLRMYSEMEHCLESRLRAGCEYGEKFSRPIMASPSSGVGVLKFVSGALLAVLAIIGLVEDKALVYLNVWGRNLFFYVALLSIVVSVTSGVASEDQSASSVDQKLASAVALLKRTFWLPEHKQEVSVGSFEVSDARKLDAVSVYYRSHFFTYRFANFLTELLALVSVPYYFLRESTFPAKLIELIDSQVFASEHLGDFCQSGWFKRGSSVELERTGNLASTVLAVPFDIGIAAVGFARQYKSFAPPAECEAMITLVALFAETMDESDNLQHEFWYYVLHVILSTPNNEGSVLTCYGCEEFLAKGKSVWAEILAKRSGP